MSGVAGVEGNDSATHLIFRDVPRRMHGGEDEGGSDSLLIASISCSSRSL